MTKIILLPLDERPCNYDFPYQLFHSDEIQIIRPEILGNKKTPAQADQLIEFLKREAKDSQALVLSIDTLLYGGLIPSRLHKLNNETVDMRFAVIKELKEINPDLLIYAFQCIMRCPSYSSSEEEPDYYEQYGATIHQSGIHIHKHKLGLCKDSERDQLLQSVDSSSLEDYMNRRQFNLTYNVKTLNLVREGVIDFLIIPQDDAAPYGYTAMDQELVRDRITAQLLQDQVLIYPGADEVELTLLSRLINTINKKRPKVYVKYASVHAPYVVPAYEDRALGETMKYQLLAANCRITESYESADFCLAVNCPGGTMIESEDQPAKNREYQVERNITEFISFIEDCIADGIPVTIGDNAFPNGGDLELIAMLNKRKLLDKVIGYAGWNTSSNTLGTSIAQGVHYYHCGKNKSHMDFLMLRYVEDGGYGGFVRTFVSKDVLPGFGMTYFDVKEQQGIVSNIIKESLEKFVQLHLSSIEKNIEIKQVCLPWKRMFEVGMDVTYYQNH